jgi:hypothetical protein
MTVVIQSSMFGLIEEGEQVVVDFCGAFLVRQMPAVRDGNCPYIIGDFRPNSCDVVGPAHGVADCRH